MTLGYSRSVRSTHHILNHAFFNHFAQAGPDDIVDRFSWREVDVLYDISSVDEGRVC